MNKVMLIGKLGKDPELTQSKTGASMSFMTLATSEKWVQNGEKKEKTMWHNLCVFGKNADNCVQFLKKGSQIYIEGKIEYSKFTDKDGVEKLSTKIICENIVFLDKGEKTTQNGGEQDSFNF